jgi:lipopolysaccharide transport system ATP-binding protein
MNAIEAHGLSKMYRIYSRPSDRLKEFFHRGRRYHQEFWALRDVSLRVPAGSTFGVIGDNGSGKSTLLQMVSGTLRPTQGVVQGRGRISPILELGAGFSPEFTGRENAFMTGAILGIGKREMERLFPEIAAFAEIGEFIDRPVKMYSTGMYFRLAFAVATSVDPDILILDEALSVGDQYFTKKCLDRIERFRRAGKTIMFCSHSMYLVRMICDQAIWLHQGVAARQGDTAAVVEAYENYVREREAQAKPVPGEAIAAEPGPTVFPWISRIRVSRDADDAPQEQFTMGDDLAITVWYQVPAPPTPVHVGIVITRNDAVQCFGTATHFSGVEPAPVSGKACLTLPGIKLLSGEYDVSAYLIDQSGLHNYDQRLREVKFRVTESVQHLGLCYLDHRWSCEALPPAPSPAAQNGD